jgi:xanthine dehydrogenase YagR molybdenum-binding subunit
MKEEEMYYIEGPLPTTPEATEDPKPWDKTEVVGKPLPRVDAYERVSGTAVFPSDVVLPGMIYGAILSCPHAHANVKRVDTSKAEKMPGVHAIITDKTPGTQIPWHFTREGAASRLFDPHCRYDGEAVAAVAADTPYQAWDAVRAIEVDYDVLPMVVDEEAAMKPGAPEVREGGNIPGEPRISERGDIARGFEEADEIVEETYRTHCQLHTPMEPHGCVAKWDRDRLTFWSSTQGVYNIQSGLARAFELPLSSIRVIGHYMGGGFGSKLAVGKFDVIAALLAKQTARPVKLVLTREETFKSMGNRPADTMRVKVGAKKDGTLTAIEFEALGSGGAYSGSGTGAIDFQVRDLYNCPNVRTVLKNVYIHAGEQRPMRGPGHPQGSFAFEQALDALAEELNMDPVDLRLKNVTTVSQVRDNIPYTSTGFKECLEEGAKAFGWGEARNRKREKEPKVRGVGMAGGMWAAGGGGPPSTAIVRLFADGSVNLNMGASDNGCGTKTVMAMIVSEELGVPLEAIQVEYADTATTQYASASGGSKTIPTESPAVRAAAIDCRNQIMQMAAKHLEVDASDLRLEKDQIASRSTPDKKVQVGQIPEFRRTRVVVGVGYRGPNPAGKAVNPFAAQFCEVEVNKRTGEVSVLRFLAAHDSGRVMNRKTYDCQVYGGVVMGIGFGTIERRMLDKGQTGKMVNANWHDYKIPTSMDIPEDITSLPIDPKDTECNTAGCKGLGEPATIPTASAVANAVYNATGVRLTENVINPTTLAQMLSGRET